MSINMYDANNETLVNSRSQLPALLLMPLVYSLRTFYTFYVPHTTIFSKHRKENAGKLKTQYQIYNNVSMNSHSIYSIFYESKGFFPETQPRHEITSRNAPFTRSYFPQKSSSSHFIFYYFKCATCPEYISKSKIWHFIVHINLKKTCMGMHKTNRNSTYTRRTIIRKRKAKLYHRKAL